MPTLDVAAHSLGISEKTLRKWMRRLEIAPTRHPQDWRFRTLTDEEVQRIADERAQMPTAAHKANMPLALLRAQSDRASPLPDTFPIPTIRKPRQDAPSASKTSGGLPDGLVSLTEVAKTHGLFRYLSNFRRARDAGKIECDPDEHPGEHGQFKVIRPLTPKGLADFYRLASPYPDFIPCPDCPHTVDASPAASE